MEISTEAQTAESEVLQLQSQVAQLQRTVHAQRAELDILKNEPASTQSSSVSSETPLLWKSCPSLECGVVRPHLVTLGNEVYVGGGNSRNLEMSRRVHKYVPGADKWESLPITPQLTFSLTTVKGFVTVIGGVNVVSSLTCGDLLHYDEQLKKWKKTFLAMPTKRSAASAISSPEYTVVAGGIHENGHSYLSTVEILNTDTMQWSKADSLPKQTIFMCITMCNTTNRIFLLGGLTRGGSISSVFSCVLPDLVESSHSDTKDVWEEITQAPYHRMGCIAMGGKLVVASGLNSEGRITKLVHVFDPKTRQWKVGGEMAASRSSCSLASLGEASIMVVGGYTNPQNWMTSLTRDVMECVNLRVD